MAEKRVETRVVNSVDLMVAHLVEEMAV